MFYCTIAETVSPAIISLIINFIGVPNMNPSFYGNIISIFVLIGYGGAIPFFYLAGKSYKKFKLANEGWKSIIFINQVGNNKDIKIKQY